RSALHSFPARRSSDLLEVDAPVPDDQDPVRVLAVQVLELGGDAARPRLHVGVALTFEGRKIGQARQRAIQKLGEPPRDVVAGQADRKSTRLNSSHVKI